MKNPKIQGRKESLILRELTLILTKELDNEILKSVSISEVRLINDNELARVYYTFLKFSHQNLNQAKVSETLENSKKRIRMLLAQKLQTRSVPDLEFVYDTSLDHANRIEAILKEVKKK
jgi:ribosome-binding factor A